MSYIDRLLLDPTVPVSSWLTSHSKGEKVTAKAHGGPIEIYGTTVAEVDDKVRLQAVDTWMDPLSMFRQIAPHGVLNKEVMNRKVDWSEALDVVPDQNGNKIAQEHNQVNGHHYHDTVLEEVVPEYVSESNGRPADAFEPQLNGCPFPAQTSMDNQQIVSPSKTVNQLGDDMNVDGGAIEAPIADTIPLPTESLVPEMLSPTAPNGLAEPGDKPAPEALGTAADRSTNVRVDRPPLNSEDSVLYSNEKKRPKLADDTHEGAESMPQENLDIQSSCQHETVEDIPRSIYSSAVTGDVEEVIKVAKSDAFISESIVTGTFDAVDVHLEGPAEEVHPHQKDVEDAVKPEAGEAVVATAESEETRDTHAEMSSIKPEECSAIMNRE